MDSADSSRYRVLKIQRFNQILRSLPGLTPRLLIMRLKELEESGLIKPIIIQKRPKLVRWVLTDKGIGTVPILLSFISYGARWYADVVFDDKRSRSVREIFPKLPTIEIS
jgi:DNA-binding HxlR family transcriptional regulator